MAGREHYLPATLLARFSYDVAAEPRRRVISIADKKSNRIFRSAAESIGFERDLYGRIDEVWQGYEQNLPEALTKLASQFNTKIDASTWLRTLVPFAASILLRSPDFTTRFERRFPAAVKDALPPKNAREARAFELQRLLAPVLASRWVILRSQSAEPIVACDVGWIHGHVGHRLTGVVIPLDTKTVLLLIPMREKLVLEWNGAEWVTQIDRDVISDEFVKMIRRTVADTAQRHVFGPTDNALSSLLPFGASTLPLDPVLGGWGSGRNGVANEFAWHRLTSNIDRSPDDPELRGFPLRPDVLADGWHPIMVLPTNVPEFPAPFHLENGRIVIRLHRVTHAHESGWVFE